MGDTLNTNQLYAVKFNPNMTECIQISAKANGHVLGATGSDVTPVKAANFLHQAKVNESKLDACKPELSHSVTESPVAKQQHPKRSKLTEEMLRETFGIFGKVERIVLPNKPGKQPRYACISK